MFQIVAVVDIDEKAPGMKLAKEMNIATGTDWRAFTSEEIDLIIEATGKQEVLDEIRKHCSPNTIVVPGTVAHIMAELVEEKEMLIAKLKSETTRRGLIFNSAHDGMIVVDEFAYITDINNSAAEMIEVDKEEVIGKHILEVIPTSGLPRVLKTKQTEFHQELKIVLTSRADSAESKLYSLALAVCSASR